VAAAREAAVEAEWELHEIVQNIKDQAKAQYGSDSHAMELLGLKRKSERRRAARRVPAGQ
jgi:hypothetical protein